jgi:hypothetical protein
MDRSDLEQLAQEETGADYTLDERLVPKTRLVHEYMPGERSVVGGVANRLRQNYPGMKFNAVIVHNDNDDFLKADDRLHDSYHSDTMRAAALRDGTIAIKGARQEAEFYFLVAHELAHLIEGYTDHTKVMKQTFEIADMIYGKLGQARNFMAQVALAGFLSNVANIAWREPGHQAAYMGIVGQLQEKYAVLLKDAQAAASERTAAYHQGCR